MDFSKLGQAAVEAGDDLTVDKKFKRELPRAGVALLRLRSYIETGRHQGANPAHKPGLKAQLIFELNHPDHLVEFDGKKEPQKFTVRLNKGITGASGYRKLFQLMNIACGGNKKHFVEMIGEAFLGEIYHKESDDKKNTYANLDLNGAYSLKAPVQVDAISNVSTPIQVAELHGTPTAFLWEPEAPTAEKGGISDEQIVEMWDSVFIEGTREVTDKVTKAVSTVSKNWIQEAIQSNIEWEGSRTQSLTQEQICLDDLTGQPIEATASKAPVDPTAGIDFDDDVAF